ncbi:MAG: hypothetical protein QOF18_1984 [Frankiaceae bacterium]|nr:hypothetical protein [Frankiaceae bacterium]
MRVTADKRLLDVAPGGNVDVCVDVINTSDIIDGVSAKLVGIDHAHVTARPAVLPLFPAGSGRVTLSVSVPASYPAGSHPLTIEVSSHTASGPPQHVDVDMVVAPYAQVQLQTRPGIQRGRRRVTFTLEITNRGNVPLDVTLSCADPDRSLHYRFGQPSVHVDAGQVVRVPLTVRAPRHFFGNELDRPLTLHAEAMATEEHRAKLGEDAGARDDSLAIMRQRPMIARGLLTALVLVSIIALWAGAFLFGLSKVFGGDPVTKAAPASFFVSQSALKGLVGQTVSSAVLAKGGPLPPGVGGVIAGKVTSVGTGAGVGRIVVEALRHSPHGLQLVTSSATQADGSYAVIGLFPGDYLLRFSAPGYHTVWYRSATSQAGAQTITAKPQLVTKAGGTPIRGFPATISGTVDPGQTTAKVRTVVVIRPLTGTSNKPVARTVTDRRGNYRFTNIPAPADYQLSFTTAGYLASTITDNVDGGQSRFEPIVRLSAGNGTVTGIVTDGTKPIGGVTVSTSIDGKTFSTGTPTIGAVGHYTLTGLPTPGTYILTFSRDAASSTTTTVDLGPGGSTTVKTVKLIGGTNAVIGTVTDAHGTLLGGATVTVGGTATPISTTTLTNGTGKGTFTITGLPVPGNYTLTVSLAGFQPTTLPVHLDGVTAPKPLPVSLSSALGAVAGIVQQPDGITPSIGATISITDGSNVRTTLTVDSADPAAKGSYTVVNLPPGHYSITATHDGYSQVTALVDVVAGSTQHLDLLLRPGV